MVLRRSEEHTSELQVSTAQLDSLLVLVNKSVSTYDPTSLISTVNKSDSLVLLDTTSFLDRCFVENFLLSRKIQGLTQGFFDPTVMPLVNLWGFGFAEKDKDAYPDSSVVDSIRSIIGMSCFTLKTEADQMTILKKDHRCQLDFSAVAKGYGVDVLADFLESMGCRNYLVEIGGEVRCIGKNLKGEDWRIGVNVPQEGSSTSEIMSVVTLNNMALATAGNYRNFYEVDGKKVSHSIKPKSGYPERSKLLSASVIAPTCAKADALATGCMVMGLESAQEMIENLEDVEAYFIFGGESGEYMDWESQNFPEIIKL